MLGVNTEYSIKAVRVKVKEKDGVVSRRCRVVLSRELDKGLARKIGSEAATVLDGLKSRGIEQAKIPITTVACIGEFSVVGANAGKGRNAATINEMNGIVATCKAPGDDEDNPTVELEFDFPWDTKAWAFLGEQCSSVVDVLLTKRQIELPIAEGED